MLRRPWATRSGYGDRADIRLEGEARMNSSAEGSLYPSSCKPSSETDGGVAKSDGEFSSGNSQLHANFSGHGREKPPKRVRPPPLWYRVLRGLIFLFQSGKCQLCQIELKEVELEIDHVNGRPWDWAPGNLRGLCKSCNIRERNLQLSKRSAATEGADSADSEELEREKIAVRADDIDKPSSAEYERGRIAFEKYRKWIVKRLVTDRMPLTTDEAINSGSEAVDVNPQTTRRYLARLASRLGPLRIRQPDFNLGRISRPLVELRPEFWQPSETPSETLSPPSQESSEEQNK